jgi:Rod binding domain-containing protein
MDLPSISATGAAREPVVHGEADLRRVAEAFEASFLAEMLRHGGLNAISAEFGGGAGEAAFSGLLTEQYARLLAERGGVGLAERIFESLKQRTQEP